MKINCRFAIGWWILGWGHEAAVVEPKALQKCIAQTAQKMAELYANQKSDKKAEPTSTAEGGFSPAQ